MPEGYTYTLTLSTILLAAILTAGLLLLLFVVVHKKRIIEKKLKEHINEIEQQKRMLKAALESQENERRQLAKDLQDDIGMMLMTLRVNLNNQPDGPLQELRQLVDKTHESIQKISWNLMPTTMDNFGLFQSTQELCERLSSIHSAKISLHEEGNRNSLDKDQELLLYRIIQEAITNAIRHSNPAGIDVRFQWTGKGLMLSVVDDGLGFDFPTSNNIISGRHGLGLFNMENRVTLLGGELSFKQNQPSGTIVSIKLSFTS